jgi:hypothetical protein
MNRRIEIEAAEAQVRPFQVRLSARAEPDHLVGGQARQLVGRLEVLELADLDVLDEVDDVSDRTGVDAADERTRRVRRRRRHPPHTTGVLPTPELGARSTTVCQLVSPVDVAVMSMVMCALLPEDLAPGPHRPPMTEVTPQSAQELTATPRIDRTEITVRKPLLLARTWRTATNERKLRPSARSKIQGISPTMKRMTKITAVAAAPYRMASCFSLNVEPCGAGSRLASHASVP